MAPDYRNIHLRFRFNGKYYDREMLKEVAYDLVKEGRPYEMSIGDFLIDWLDDYDSVQVRTSGSTGLPKSISIKKQYMVNSALATGDFFGLTVGDKALLCLPANYIAGKMMLVRAMILGLELDVIEPSSKPLEETDKTYDFAAMIPLQVQNSLDELHRVRTVIIGGAPVSEELKEALKSCTSRVYSTYGMTETVTHIAAKDLNGETGHYKLLPGVSVHKDDRGCLVIEAFKVSEETIVTNDLVEIYEDGGFEWQGRFDNVINSGGIKLIPELLEMKLQEVVDVPFFVISVNDAVLGDKLVMVIEGEESMKDSIMERIKTYKHLDKYERPKEIFCIDKFIETENGKILRKATLSECLS